MLHRKLLLNMNHIQQMYDIFLQSVWPVQNDQPSEKGKNKKLPKNKLDERIDTQVICNHIQ